MDLRAFIEERRPHWTRLEILLQKCDMTGFALSQEEAQELGALYRRASADLCRAQARTANAEVLRYLNALVGRAYGQIYSGQHFRFADLLDFALRGYPALIRERWRAIALAGAILLLGVLFGALAASLDEDARHFLLPENYREACEQIGAHSKQLQGNSLSPGMSSIFSSAIMWNNISVCFTAFAFGLTLGFGTGIILFQNGVLVGVLASYFFRAGYGTQFLALILPHGVIELFAIFIAGGAGLVVGRALMAPGGLTRTQALRREGAVAVKLVFGTVPMLFVAGVIEGFLTPQGYIPDVAKLGFAAATGVALMVYLAPPGALARLLRR